MFIELHMIQNFAPSNLNRDDTNNPKDTEFGGVRRARISSQCIKRAIRNDPAFARATAVDPGIRTRWITRLISRSLESAGKPAGEAQTVTTAFTGAYIGKMDKEGHTNVLMYISPGEVKIITDGLLKNWEAVLGEATAGEAGKNEAIKSQVDQLIKETKNRTSAPDIALFGRMLADKPELSLDAACQVAHAISTHRISMEMDFFTAVDDLLESHEPGAGMMGFTGFNSSTFYRYARIHWEQLLINLDGDADLARRTVEGFLRASVAAVPSGKQNSFAAQNPPSFLLSVVRQDGMGWSLANAFEKPVRAGMDGGLISPSVEALDDYWGSLSQVYGTVSLSAVNALVLDGNLPLENLKGSLKTNLNSWIESTLSALPQEA
jgi:CRISPR system Cascade subunit CasC